jgi:eukaryotic-like serine/threonine-protein kinase
VWDVERGEPLVKIPHQQGTVHSLVWSPDGRRLASAGADRSLRVWGAP